MTRAISEKQLIFPLKKWEKIHTQNEASNDSKKVWGQQKVLWPSYVFHQMNHLGTKPTPLSHEAHVLYLWILFLYTGIFPKKLFWILFLTFSSNSISCQFLCSLIFPLRCLILFLASFVSSFWINKKVHMQRKSI